MKTIEITISPDGQSRVETKGFSGSQCVEASNFLIVSLGQSIEKTIKPEYYQPTAEENRLRHHQ